MEAWESVRIAPNPPASGVVAEFCAHDSCMPRLRDSEPHCVAPLASRFFFRQADPGAGPRVHNTLMPSASRTGTVNKQPTRIWPRGIPQNGARVEAMICTWPAKLRQELAA